MGSDAGSRQSPQTRSRRSVRVPTSSGRCEGASLHAVAMNAGSMLQLGTTPSNSELNLDRTFLHMYHRKLLRRLRGTHHASQGSRFCFAFSIIVMMFGAATVRLESGELRLILLEDSINVASILLFCVFVLVVWVLAKLAVLVRWCLYWLVLAAVLLQVTTGSIAIIGPGSAGAWVLVALGIVELLTMVIYWLVHFWYPRLVHSWVQTPWWLRIRRLAPSAVSYKNVLSRRQHVCSYRGSFNSNGLPDGWGEWCDDAYHGECLSGRWKDGAPVGPFRSREYGSGYSFSCVWIGYVSCRSDDFDTSAWSPQNSDSPTIGVASVESSVSGSFFSHLPLVRQLFNGDRPLNASNMEWCLRRVEAPLPTFGGSTGTTSITITADATDGVLVSGHAPVCVESDSGATEAITSVVVEVVRPEVVGRTGNQREDETGCHVNTEARQWRSLSHMAREVASADARRLALPDESLDSFEAIGIEGAVLPRRHRNMAASVPTEYLFSAHDAAPGCNEARPTLRVPGWLSKSEGHTEALIFVPGFNISLEGALSRFGQLLALGGFPAFIKPIIFSWPCGRELTYFQAKRTGTSTATRYAMISMLEELRANGVRDVHFLVHSLGSTVVLRSICDDDERKIAGLFAECDRQHTSQPHASSRLLRLKTFTLLHPDCSLKRFVDNDFVIMRRICNRITVLGDANDKALFWSELVNRDYVAPGSGVERTRCSSFRRIFGHSVRSVGRAVFALHDGAESDEGIESGQRKRRWLDLDALDTTWLESNVHAMRHNYFTLNPVLVEDLVELIVTGKRAVERTLLLRRGRTNIFSYCSAPSCVVND